MNKNEFIDTSHEVKGAMAKLSKDALKAGGKIITKILKNDIAVRTGGLKKSIVAWAKLDKNTGQPYMEVGYRSRSQMKKKYGIKYFVNPHWFEFGTKPHIIMTKELKNTGKSSYELKDHRKSYGVKIEHPGMRSTNLLRDTVYNNTKEIQAAQQEYLGQLTEMMIEQGAKFKVEEDEEIDD